MLQSPRFRYILRAILGYLIFGTVWILLSDSLLALFTDITRIRWLSQAKGIFFVIMTTAFLYYGLLAVPDHKSANLSAGQSFRSQLLLFRWPRWIIYVFAITSTLALLIIRANLPLSFDQRPMLNLFMLPIILSALVGGLGPGIVSTFIAVLGQYFLSFQHLQDHNSFPTLDLFQLGMLFFNGLLVSALSYWLHALLQQTEQDRLAQKEQLAALGLLAAVADNSSDAIYAKDVNGHYLMFNQEAAKITGKAIEEVLGQDDNHLFPPEQAEQIMLKDQKIISEKVSMNVLEELTTVNGLRIFSSTKGPLLNTDGIVIGSFGITRDISQLKQTEAALIKERDRNQRYLDTVQTIMLVLNTAGVITMINRQGCQLLGYQVDELLGRNWFKHCLPQPIGMVKLYPRFCQIMQEKQPAINYFENTVQCKDGQQRIIAWHCIYLIDDHGNLTETLSSGEDITERKQAELSLKKSEQRFRSLFQELPIALSLVHNNGVILDFNRRFEKNLGYTRAELPTLDEWWLLAYPDADYREWVIDHWNSVVNQAIATGSDIAPQDYRVTCKNGDVRHMIISGISLGNEFLITLFDITERKKLELEISASKGKLEAAMASMTDAVFISDLEGQNIEFNNAFAISHKFANKNECFNTLSQYPDIFELYSDSGQLLPVDQWPISRAFRGESGGSYECRIWRRDTDQSWAASYSYAPIRNEKDGIVGAVVTVRDITERLRAESAVYDRLRIQDQLTKIAATVPGVICSFRLRPDGSVSMPYASPSFERLYGLKHNEVAEDFSPVFARLHPEDTPHVQASIAESASSMLPWRDTYRYHHPQKGEIWIEGHSMPERETDGSILWHGYVQDITDRKAIESELVQLAQAVEQSPESIIITNLKGEIEYVNHAFSTNSGYSAEEVIGRNLRLLKSGHTPLETYTALWDTLKQGNNWKGEFCNQRKDGSDYIEFAIITPLRQPNGQITHYVSVQEDITEKKRIADELNQHRNQLEELVSLRTAEAEKAKQIAELANQSKSAFLANMSHEIRTPMNAIIGMNYLLRKNASDSVQIERLNKVDVAAQHLLSIINDILDLSKIEAGHLELENRDFALTDIIDPIFSVYADLAALKEISLKIDTDHVPSWLHGDATRLRQALFNYIGNAIKFTEQGIVTVSAKLVEEIDGELLIRFEVHDSGIGIAVEKLELLFEAFTQADVSTTREFGGTGLGLAITKRLANLMGGEVGVSSQPNNGSTFWFTAKLQHGVGEIPKENRNQSVDQGAQLAGIPFQNVLILLVEDNPINQEVALEILQDFGLVVDVADNGRIALEKISNKCYDLILMDVQMPEMDGIAATKAIRQLEGKQNLPIIAMTANAFEEDKSACLAAGMNDFASKPVVPENLYAILKRWLPSSKISNQQPENTQFNTLGNSEAKLNSPENLANELTSIAGLEISDTFKAIKDKNPTKFNSLLALFAKHHQHDMQKIRSLLADSNTQDAQKITHTLKGVVGNIDQFNCAMLVNDLDTALRDQASLAECLRLNELCEQQLTPVINKILSLTE